MILRQSVAVESMAGRGVVSRDSQILGEGATGSLRSHDGKEVIP